MVALGAKKRDPGAERKRSSAARDLPDAGGPVINSESAKVHYKLGEAGLMRSELRREVAHHLLELFPLFGIQNRDDARLPGGP